MVAVYFGFFHARLGFARWDPSAELVVGVGVTTVGWLVVTFLTPPVNTETLRDFHAKIRPLGKGWDAVVPTSGGAGPNASVQYASGDSGSGDSGSGGEIAAGLLAWFLGCVMVYGALFGTGFLLYGNLVAGVAGLVVAALAGGGVLKLLPRVGFLT